MGQTVRQDEVSASALVSAKRGAWAREQYAPHIMEARRREAERWRDRMHHALRCAPLGYVSQWARS